MLSRLPWPPPAHTPDPRSRGTRNPPGFSASTAGASSISTIGVIAGEDPLLSPPSAAAPAPLPPHLQPLALSLLRRLDDLDAHQSPQLAHCPGPLSLHHQLAAACRAELAGCRRDLEELKLEVDDLERARDRAAATTHLQALQQRIDSSTKLYRQAVIASKRQIDTYGYLATRDELLGSAAGDSSGRASPSPYGGAQGAAGNARGPSAANQSADDALMSATSDVTEGLRRTLQLMQQEVDRSLMSNELLESQTKTMELTSQQYSTLSSLLHTSRALISALERSAILDRLVLWGAFAFFAAVCAHIVKKRVVDRGVHVLGAVGSVVGTVGRTAARAGSAAVAGKVAPGDVAGEVVEQASEVVHRAGSAVGDEARGELARAAAAREEEEYRDFRRVAQPVQQQQQEEEEVRSTDPTSDRARNGVEFDADADADADSSPQDDRETFFDASETHSPSPSESSVASSSSTPLSPPAAQLLPLEDVPRPEAGRGLFQVGDPDLHQVPPPLPLSQPPPHEATVLLREERPPVPTGRVDVEDVFFEDVFVDPGFEPEVETRSVADSHRAQKEEEEEGDEARSGGGRERVFVPLDRLPSTTPDGDDDYSPRDIPVTADAEAPEEQDERAGVTEEQAALPAVEEAAKVHLEEEEDGALAARGGFHVTEPVAADLPPAFTEDSLEPPPVAPDDRIGNDDNDADALHVEEDAAFEAPGTDSPSLAAAAETADEMLRVAEVHAGGEGGTRVPEVDERREGGLPRLELDDDDDHHHPDLLVEGVVETQSELPVDFATEQTRWEMDRPADDAGGAQQQEEEAANVEKEEEETFAEHNDEALLDELLDAHLGGIFGGSSGAVPADLGVHESAMEPELEIGEEEAEHAGDLAPSSGTPSTESVPLPVDDESGTAPLLEDVTGAEASADGVTLAPIPADVPTPASTAAAAPSDLAAPYWTDDNDELSTAPLTAVQTAVGEIRSEQPHYEGDGAAPEPPAAEAEEAVEAALPASTNAAVAAQEGRGEVATEYGQTEEADSGDDESLAQEYGEEEEEEGGERAAVSGHGDTEKEGDYEDGPEPGSISEAEDEAGEVPYTQDADYPAEEPESDETILTPNERDADLPNSDVVFPDPSIDEDDHGLTGRSTVREGDYSEDDLDAEEALFEIVQDQAAADHLGEPPAGSDGIADEALRQAQDMLDELDHQDGDYQEDEGEEWFEELYEGEHDEEDGAEDDTFLPGAGEHEGQGGEEEPEPLHPRDEL